MKPLTPEDFAVATGVSRETLSRLEAYAALLERWQSRINLVSGTTLSDLWRRHILDSAQLYPLVPDPGGQLVDLGSGAGLPGLVLAAMGIPHVRLVESDKRKATFLREASRAMGLTTDVIADRAEAMSPVRANTITARAFAPLPRLLALAEPLIGPETVLVLPKGRSADEELTDALRAWTMAAERFPSLTDSSGVILRLKGVSRGTSS